MSVTITLTISVFRPSKVWYFRFHHCFCVRNPLKSRYISVFRHESRSISDFRVIETPLYLSRMKNMVILNIFWQSLDKLRNFYNIFEELFLSLTSFFKKRKRFHSIVIKITSRGLWITVLVFLMSGRQFRWHPKGWFGVPCRYFL